MHALRILLLLIFLPAAAVAGELPDDSIYQVGSTWRDQDDRSLSIDELRGRVQAVVFMYTWCEHSCPIILSTLKRLDGGFTRDERAQLQFLMISLDPARDTPATLRAYMQKHDLDARGWRMLSGDAADVRELSMLLGVRYRPMDADGKDIAHSNMITVLDREGRVHYQMKGLHEDLDQVKQAVRDAISR